MSTTDRRSAAVNGDRANGNRTSANLKEHGYA
jgi:hypothetical protein